MRKRSACCIVTDAFLHELPERVLQLADRNRYPILLIPEQIPYGELIRDTSEMLLVESSEAISEAKIQRLLYDNPGEYDVAVITRYLNRNFLNFYAMAYFKPKNLAPLQWRMLMSDLRMVQGFQPLKFQDGAFVVFNYSAAK